MKNILKTITMLIVFLSVLACKEEVRINQVKSKLVKLYEIEDITRTEVRAFAGTLVEGKKANLSFRLAGPIEAVFVEEGQYVEEGQLLAKLDDRDYQLQYSAVKAQYDQISNEVQRIESLYKKGNVSANDYEKAVSGLSQITAKYQSMQNSLNDVELLAPYSGFIQDIFFEQGEIVKAGLPLISMISDKNLQVQCDIPAIVYVNRDKFSSFNVTLESIPQSKIPLELVNIKHKSNLNSLYRVYFKVKDSQKYNTDMAVGMDCEVEITYELETSEDQRVIKVPMESIIQTKDESYVWLCTQDKQGKYIVNKRIIKIVGIDDSGLVMISDGLQAGDKVIKAGVHELMDKQEVIPVKEPSPSNYGGLL